MVMVLGLLWRFGGGNDYGHQCESVCHGRRRRVHSRRVSPEHLSGPGQDANAGVAGECLDRKRTRARVFDDAKAPILSRVVLSWRNRSPGTRRAFLSITVAPPAGGLKINNLMCGLKI